MKDITESPQTDKQYTGKETEEPEAGRPPLWKDVLDYVVTLVIVGGAVLLINTFILINARIPSESMEYTIMKGDQIFGNRLSYRFSDPERFDIIIFRYPDDPKQYFIKRIVGMPGELVTIANGKVYIDGSTEPLDDSFIAEPQNPEYGGKVYTYEVPENSYFVMGDNRNHSRDSRYWNDHFVERDEILGKAVFRYWPIWKMRTFGYSAPAEEEP